MWSEGKQTVFLQLPIICCRFWIDGEPNDLNNEDCAAVYPQENFFKACNDAQCESKRKWICEKAPSSKR